MKKNADPCGCLGPHHTTELQITGRSGTGKASSSGKLHLNSLSQLPGVLVLAEKPNDSADWQKTFAAVAPEDDPTGEWPALTPEPDVRPKPQGGCA